MLTTIGKRRKAPNDLVDLMLECHERIRASVALAKTAGSQADFPDSEVIEACSRVERYFTEALPLHVRDEDESLLPRLSVHAPEVGSALQAMHDQHRSHEPILRALLAACASLRQNPREAERRAALAKVASDLAQEFDEHLALEEKLIFPAVRRAMPVEVQAEIVSELRGRRVPQS